MEIQFTNSAVFETTSPLIINKILSETIIIESLFNQNPSSINNDSLSLILNKHYIIAKSNSLDHNHEAYVCQINFDLKFEIIYIQEKNVKSNKIGIKFLINSNKFNCFYTNNLQTIQKWIIHLSKLINQRGFHELFKPLRKLGKGNFASVYQVQRITDLQKFAVKAFSKQNTFAAKNGKQSLMNQLSILRELNHSNVLRLQSVFQSDNSIYVILQVLNGGQLFHKIQKTKGHFTKKQIKQFMKGLLQGLSHMHENRIMHRDLKPQNIMLRSQNQMDPVIVDFGLATHADLSKYLFYRCGTPGYVAPQIVSLTQNIPIQPQCDVFSAGVIFHILLTRRPLFQGTKYEQVYRNNKNMNFDLRKPIYEKLQFEELQLLKKMLIVQPSQRLSAKEALEQAYFNQLSIQKQQIDQTSSVTTISQKTQKIRKLIKVV